MNSNRKTAVITGMLFIIATLTGPILATPLIPDLTGTDYLIQLSAHTNQVATAVLLSISAYFACAGIAIALYPVLKERSTGLALGSVTFRTIEAAFYLVGVVSLLSLMALGQQFQTMKAALTRRLNTTWTAAGLLTGRGVKRRSVPQPRIAASAYAMFAGYLLGLRGEILTSSVFAPLVGADPSIIVSHLYAATRNGWLRFRHAGGVMEIDFSGLLLPEEEALLHGAH